MQSGLERFLSAVKRRLPEPVITILHWISWQINLLFEHGIVARFNSLVMKILRPVARRIIVFINSRPRFRRRCVALASWFGLHERLKTVYSQYSYLSPRVDSFDELMSVRIMSAMSNFYADSTSKENIVFLKATDE